MDLYTVEYEEKHAGQTAAGVGDFWFKRVDPFRKGDIDDPFRRANDMARRLLSNPSKFRDVRVLCWTGCYEVRNQ